MPIAKYVTGDLLKASEPFIAHGVNCRATMGAGVAREIAKKWPNSELKYREYCFKNSANSRAMLGKSLATYEKEDKKILFHVFTQEKTGMGERQVDYGAIARGFATINDDLKIMWEKDVIAAHEAGEKEIPPMPVVAIPKIGSGLGGGHWPIIEEILNGVTPDIALIVYEQKEVA